MNSHKKIVVLSRKILPGLDSGTSWDVRISLIVGTPLMSFDRISNTLADVIRSIGVSYSLKLFK